MTDRTRRSHQIVIAGAGMSGICLAIQLKRAGFSDFVVLEKSLEAGGTWLDNSYPNAGCDIPSFLYSFSFAPKYDWSQKYARQPEILRYFLDCIERFGIRQHILFDCAVDSATYDERNCRWRLVASNGLQLDCSIFVSAVGQLNRPRIPDIPGLVDFGGASWHSARWNHQFDLRGKRIAIIGNGASSIQFLPEVAQQAANVLLFQRSPCWVSPLRNYHYPSWAHRAFRFVPGAAAAHRMWIFLTSEWRSLVFKRGGFFSRESARWIRKRMREQIPLGREQDLLPDYPPGCKRILLSNDYLQTLGRENVQLVTQSIARFQPQGICTESTSYPVDAVIFGTGFDTHRFLYPMRIAGRSGELLEQAWSDRPRTLYGMATVGFPNLFFLYGPNTNLGHNSVIYMVECQVKFILRCLRRMRKRSQDEIEVSREAMERFDQQLQVRLQETVWAGDCSSWYKTADGSIPNNWWGPALAYRLQTRRPDFSEFRFGKAVGQPSSD